MTIISTTYLRMSERLSRTMGTLRVHWKITLAISFMALLTGLSTVAQGDFVLSRLRDRVAKRIVEAECGPLGCSVSEPSTTEGETSSRSRTVTVGSQRSSTFVTEPPQTASSGSPTKGQGIEPSTPLSLILSQAQKETDGPMVLTWEQNGETWTALILVLPKK